MPWTHRYGSIPDSLSLSLYLSLPLSPGMEVFLTDSLSLSLSLCKRGRVLRSEGVAWVCAGVEQAMFRRLRFSTTPKTLRDSVAPKW